MGSTRATRTARWLDITPQNKPFRYTSPRRKRGKALPFTPP